MNKNSKKLLITESEKDFILKMYGIIKEQEESGEVNIQPQKVQDKPEDTETPATIENKQIEVKRQQKPVFSTGITENFKAGYHSDKFLDKTALNKLVTAVNSIVNNSDGLHLIEVFITVTAGESSIPNTDNESNPPVAIGVGELAKLRKKTIDTWLSQEISQLIKNKGKIYINNVPIVLPKIAWDPVKFKQNPQQYYDEQFIYIKLDIYKTSKDYTCLNGMTIDINYEKPGDHKCNNAIFQVFLNNVLINRNDGKPYGNLNNDGKFDEGPEGDNGGSRYNRFVVTNEMATQIASKGLSSTYGLPLTIKCVNAKDVGGEEIKTKRWGDGCHTSVGDIIITPKLTKQTTVLRGGTPGKRGETSVVGRFKPCGGKITQS
jgi:hypothetical protein